MAKQVINNGDSGATVRAALNTNFNNIFTQGFRGSYPPGSLILQIGDSKTSPGADWEGAYTYEWLASGGIFNGCEMVNLGKNGTQILGWYTSIAEGDQEDTATAPSDPTNIWVAKNLFTALKHGLIILMLGTNDFWNVERRAQAGTEAEIQDKFDAIVQFLLDNCPNADLLLCIPSPFVYPGGSDPHPMYGVWTDLAQCTAYSELMRRLYLNCSNRHHPRVRIWDSHADMWGTHIDSIDDAVDDETNLLLMYDDLHEDAIGYRRRAQRVADFLRGSKAKPPAIALSPNAMLQPALYSETLYLSNTTVAGADVIASFYLDPMTAFDGYYNTLRTATNAKPESQLHYLPAMRALARFGPLSRVLSMGSTGGEAKVFAWCHNSGNVYSMALLAASNYVTVASPYYCDCIAENLQNEAADTPAAWSDDDIGPVTFFVKDMAHAPNTTRNQQYETMRLCPNEDESAAIATGATIGSMKFAAAFTEVTFSGYCVTAPSGSYCSWQVAKNGVDLMPSGIYFLDGVHDAASPGFSSVSFAVGDIMSMRCLGNPGNAKGITFLARGKRVLY